MAKKVKKTRPTKKKKKAAAKAKKAKTETAKKAAKKAAKKTAKKAKPKADPSSSAGTTKAHKAGKPVMPGAFAPAAATAGPSDDALDLRDRLKSGPRRQAGPPLAGDMPNAPAMAALRNEVLPSPTEPKDP